MARTSENDRPQAQDEDRPAGSALAELIEIEARIEAEVAEAEARAGTLVEAAQHDARHLESDSNAALDDALHGLRASLEAESAAAAQVVAERAEAEAERYRSIDDARVQRLGKWVASRVVGGSGVS